MSVRKHDGLLGRPDIDTNSKFQAGAGAQGEDVAVMTTPVNRKVGGGTRTSDLVVDDLGTMCCDRSPGAVRLLNSNTLES